MNSRAWGINVFGYTSANLGLGHTAREFCRVIESLDIPLAVVEIEAGHGRDGFDNTFSSRRASDRTSAPFAVNLMLGGADALSGWMIEPTLSTDPTRPLNAAFVWWELPDLRPDWIEAARAFDVLIAGSDFVHATLSNAVPGVPVLLARHPIRMPDVIPRDRNRFGLPTESLLFYMGFEPLSDPWRKNPFAAIAAFQSAFRTDTSCRLVVRLNNAGAQGEASQAVNRLCELAAADRRIILLRENLPYESLLSLYASCDVFVSLHRSEGLGLVPLEAMRLGKPVIATGWSGNMSYMNQRNACLVRYDFAATDDRSSVYGPKALGVRSHWAEPDVEHAAQWMRKLADDEAFRRTVGERAAADAAAYEVMARQATFLDELKAIWDLREMLPRRDGTLVKARVSAARRQLHLSRLPPTRRVVETVSGHVAQLFNQHILWRLRRRKLS